MGALAYLTFCSLKNRTRARLRRLREPRYLAGTVAGVLYFYLVFVQPRQGSPAGVWSRLAASATLEAAATAFLFLITAIGWVWPGSGKPALPFTRAEVQFLFPAPLTRRRLIVYRLLRSQLAAFGGSAIVTLFLRPGSLASSWTVFLGMSLVMATLNVHLTAVTLSRESVSRHGLSGLARQWLPIAVVVAVVAALAVPIALEWPRLSALPRARDFWAELGRLMTTGAAGAALWPFRAVARLPLAGSPAAFLAWLPPVLAILALNVVWVLRSDVAFEEASAEMAERIARGARVAPKVRQARRAATPFTLALSGRPETAVLWKNLILLGRYASLRTLLILLPMIVGFGVALSQASRADRLEFLGVLISLMAVLVVFMGPMAVRNDLRQDLANLAVLKTWPIRGAALVRGEILAPVLVLSATAWLMIVAAVSLSSHLFFAVLFSSPARALASIGAAMLLAPGLIAAQIAAHNGLAVMFPAWVSIGPSRGQGTEAMGQRLIVMAGMIVVLVLAAIPAAVLGGLAGWLLFLVTGRLAIFVPAAIASAALFGECLAATELIGQVLDRTDISAIDAPE